MTEAITPAPETRKARLAVLEFARNRTAEQAEIELQEIEGDPEKLAQLDAGVQLLRARFKEQVENEAQEAKNRARDERIAKRAKYLEPVVAVEGVLAELASASAEHIQSARRLLEVAQRVQVAVPHGDTLQSLSPRALAFRVGEDLLRIVAGDQVQLQNIITTEGNALVQRLQNAAPNVEV